MNTSDITSERVRNFLITRYAGPIQGKVANPAETPDGFDFLLEGVVDSFGVLEMVSDVEKEFGIELDMSGLDAEQMTVLGPLSRYVAAQVNQGGSSSCKNGPSV